jgi:hypothetical protein
MRSCDTSMKSMYGETNINRYEHCTSESYHIQRLLVHLLLMKVCSKGTREDIVENNHNSQTQDLVMWIR